MHSTHCHRPLRAFAVAGVLVASSASAQNLIPNPEFDDDVLPWGEQNGDSPISYALHDHDGCAAADSGSALATHNAAAAGATRGFHVCIPVEPSQFYSFGADLRFPASQSRTGTAQIWLIWFPQADCVGVATEWDISPVTLSTATAGNWTRIQHIGAVSLFDSESALLSVRVVKNEAGGSLELDVDGAFIFNDVDPLWSDGFTSASTCHWDNVQP